MANLDEQLQFHDIPDFITYRLSLSGQELFQLMFESGDNCTSLKISVEALLPEINDYKFENIYDKYRKIRKRLTATQWSGEAADAFSRHLEEYEKWLKEIVDKIHKTAEIESNIVRVYINAYNAMIAPHTYVDNRLYFNRLMQEDHGIEMHIAKITALDEDYYINYDRINQDCSDLHYRFIKQQLAELPDFSPPGGPAYTRAKNARMRFDDPDSDDE